MCIRPIIFKTPKLSLFLKLDQVVDLKLLHSDLLRCRIKVNVEIQLYTIAGLLVSMIGF